MNLNGVVYRVYGISGFFTYFYLLSTFIILSSDIYLKSLWKSGELQVFRFILLFYSIYFALALIASFINVSGTSDHIEGMRSFATTVLFLLASASIVLEAYVKRNTRIFYFFCISVIISSLSGTIFSILEIEGLFAFGSITDRYSGFFANPNELGTQGCFSLVFVFYLLSKELSLKWKLGLFVLLFLICLSIIYTFSRASIVTMVLVVFSSVMYRFFKKSKSDSLLKGGLFFIILVLAGNFFYSSYLIDWQDDLSVQQLNRIENVLKIFSGEINENTLKGRYEFGVKAIDKFWESPFIGHGLNSFHSIDGGLGAHNMYLTILGESGLLGGGAFIILCLVYYFRNRRLNNELGFFSLLLFSVFLLTGFVSHNLLDDRTVNIYIVIGALSPIYKR